jgi:glycosyltransferase involved in cell wall biosynthesis
MTASVPVTFVSSHARRGGAEHYLETLVQGLGPVWVSGVVCLEEGPLAERLRRQGVATAVLPTGSSAVSIARSALRLRRLLRRDRPAVVHANGIKAAIVSVLATPGTGLPVVWVKHDFSWDGWLTRFVASRCREVIGVSAAVTESFPERLRAKVRVIHNGLPAFAADGESGRKALEELLGATPSQPVVSLVGRIDPGKGHRELLAAVPLVLERAPGTRFAFVGSEHAPHLEYAAALRRESVEGGLAEAVRFLGFREDARDLIAGSDVLAVPTIVDEHGFGRESFSFVALEAMALATPVVGYAEGGLPEVLDDCGSLVQSGDRRALAEAIVRLLEDQGLRERLGRCGQERARRGFSFEGMRDAMQECYLAAAA